MLGTQLCTVSQYTPTTLHTLSGTSTMATIGGTGAATNMNGMSSNQLPPTTNMSTTVTNNPNATTATAALGYINGILYLEHDATSTTKISTQHQQQQQQRLQRHIKPHNVDSNNVIHAEFKNDVDHKKVTTVDYDADNIDNVEHEDESDSFGSMETLSDNVAIWVDGEKHWISGVDSSTTCAELICALLNYQDGQQMFQNAALSNDESVNKNSDINSNNSNNSNSNNNGNVGNNNGNNPINQSNTNTKEDTNKNTQTTHTTHTTEGTNSGTSTAKGISNSLNDYVIVKQHRHCEEYLDGSTKVFDVLPTRDITDRKECELMLRRLAASPLITTQVSSLLSTDKDSGIAASPVGSSRSARFRRRKHKSANWLAQSNTLHPKLAQRGSYSNERLLKIILAQDETIHRQLSLLREKERQISKIEEEKHRVRERELGKNYLLETYLNGLDEAEVEPDLCDGVEIFIDEPYHQFSAPEITTTTTTKHLPASNAATVKAKSLLKSKQKQHKQRKEHKAEDIRRATEETYHEEANCPPHNTHSAASGNPKEIELQILWLEKVYAINKQLQREEELLVKLHAKIRKHHVKRAYQTKNEVLQQIDKLDTEIARQCVDIRKVEDNLETSDEQLKQKLCLLEKLNEEFVATAQPASVSTSEAVSVAVDIANLADTAVNVEIKDAASGCDIKDNCVATATAAAAAAAVVSTLTAKTQPQQGNIANKLMANKITTTANTTKHCTPTMLTTFNNVQANKVLQDLTMPAQALTSVITTTTKTTATAAATTPATIPKVNLNEIYTTEDLQNLQKLIAKPTEASAAAAAAAVLPIKSTSTAATFLPTADTATHQLDLLQHTNYAISRINHNVDEASSNTAAHLTTCTNITTQAHTPANILPQQYKQQQHVQQQHQQQQLQQQQQQLVIDKNILPLHVNNVKTLKKQMFCTKSFNTTTSTVALHSNNTPQQQQQQQQQPQLYLQQSSSNYIAAPLPLAVKVQQLLPAPLDVKSVDISRIGTLV